MATGAANHITQLRAGQSVPAGARRVGTYTNGEGYQRVRYQTGLRRYVEQYVHRANANPAPGQQVDHKNRDRGDNRRSNLQSLSPSRHATIGNLRRRVTSGTPGRRAS